MSGRSAIRRRSSSAEPWLIPESSGTTSAAFRSRPGFPAIPQAHIPDYATVDLRGGVEFGKFTVEAYVKNLTNSDGISSLETGITDQALHNNILPGGAIRAAFIRPRTIGVSLSAGF